MFIESQNRESPESNVSGNVSPEALPLSHTSVSGKVLNGDEPLVRIRSKRYLDEDAAYDTSHGAFEIKFLIDMAQLNAVKEWTRRHMQPDPNASADIGDGYCVNSLYLDTPTFDVFHRNNGFRQRKYRLRRYGSEPVIWTELKRKNEGRVHKRRTSVASEDLHPKLLGQADETWEGSWFRGRLDEYQLRPVCQVTYRRYACVGESACGPIRLTIDSHLNCQRAHAWDVPDQPLQAIQLMSQHQILEFKFREAIPQSFRELTQELGLSVATFSKYRQSVEACIPLQELMCDSPEQTA